MAIGNHCQTLEDLDTIMHSHLNELGVVCLNLQMVVEQVEVQKEMILRFEDVNKHLETEQDHLHESLTKAFAQITWLCAWVVIPREVLGDSSDSSNNDDDEDGPDEG